MRTALQVSASDPRYRGRCSCRSLCFSPSEDGADDAGRGEGERAEVSEGTY